MRLAQHTRPGECLEAAQQPQASLEVLEAFIKMAAPYLAAPPLIKLYRGDFMAHVFDWTDADLVFAHSTCFEEELVHRISKRAGDMQPGTWHHISSC